jgi:tetratricopeptide (TPR) repeat protein
VTWPATSLWRDDRSLWTAATELTPASPRAWAGLSRVHRVARERDEADRAMARALNADPRYAPALVTELYNDLAFGRLETAREHLAALDAKKLGDGGGIGKARRCAALEREAAAACIGP